MNPTELRNMICDAMRSVINDEIPLEKALVLTGQANAISHNMKVHMNVLKFRAQMGRTLDDGKDMRIL